MERRDLGRLPPDLQAMGWQWISVASTAIHHLGTTRYTAVYGRLFQQHIDEEHSMFHHRGDRWVWVSTHARTNANWDDAHRDAIALMRDADARRKSA